MTLTTRLWLSGVLVPVLVVSALLFGADRMFHWELERALDRALLAQAAIESVSLFDSPTQSPHLHMATSPLLDSVLPFAPEGVLFGPNGSEVMRFPHRDDHTHAHERVPPVKARKRPVLSTVEREGVRERQLHVTVTAPRTGEPYTLRLTAGMAQIDTATETFHRMALWSVLAMTLVLVTVQTWQSRTLRRRLSELSTHVEAIRAGDLEQALSAESEGDELTALRTLLSEATAALKTARTSKERLLADAAHELRTPLTVMRTSLDLALRRERSMDELKAALHDTREEVDRLSQLASRLLDMVATAHDAEPTADLDVSALLRQAVTNAQPVAEARQVHLALHAPASLSIQGRAQSLRRAVDNLISNAIKFARTTVTVQVTHDAGRLCITVHDDGPGIAEAERELVFEPFHRSAGSPPGAGLGLAIVREVAHAYGGRAYAAESTDGATLVLDVPVTHRA